SCPPCCNTRACHWPTATRNPGLRCCPQPRRPAAKKTYTCEGGVGGLADTPIGAENAPPWQRTQPRTPGPCLSGGASLRHNPGWYSCARDYHKLAPCITHFYSTT